MAVTSSAPAAVNFSAPRTVCDLPPSTYLVYGMSRDGKHFLTGLTDSSTVLATQVNVVVGWFGELRQKFLSAK